MFDVGQPDTFWLNFTNIALGLVTLLCFVLVAAGAVEDLLVRMRRRAAAADDHTFVSPELGPTMADGGERLDRQGGDGPGHAGSGK